MTLFHACWSACRIVSRVMTGPPRYKAGPWWLSSHAAVSGPQSPPSRTRTTFDNTQRAVSSSGASTFAVGADAGTGEASSSSISITGSLTVVFRASVQFSYFSRSSHAIPVTLSAPAIASKAFAVADARRAAHRLAKARSCVCFLLNCADEPSPLA